MHAANLGEAHAPGHSRTLAWATLLFLKDVDALGCNSVPVFQFRNEPAAVKGVTYAEEAGYALRNAVR